MEAKLFDALKLKVSSNPDKPILVAVKGRYPFITDLRGLDLSNCVSILVINRFHLPDLHPAHAAHFDFVLPVDLGEFWLGGALTRLDTLELTAFDQAIDDLIGIFKSHQSDHFRADRIRFAVLEEQFVRLVAKARERHGIPGAQPDDVERFSDKACMKQWAMDRGVATAKYLIVTPGGVRDDEMIKRELIELGYPIMMKPLHGVGGAGICKIESSAHLDQWLSSTHIDAQMEYLAEEFIEGIEYQALALVQQTNHTIQMFPGLSKTFHPGIHTALSEGVPVSFGPERDPNVSSMVERFVLDAVREFQPPRGTLVTVQSFLTADGTVTLSELAIRVPGMIGSVMFVENNGISPETVQIMAPIRRMDLRSMVPVGTVKEYCANVCYPKVEGIVKAIDPMPNQANLSSRVKVKQVFKVGDKSRKASNIGDMSTRVLLWNENIDELEKDVDWVIKNYQPIVIE